MSKHHIGLDVALALVYCFICTVLLLVLSLPLPYKGIIKHRMGPVINTLMYGLIAPVWVLINSTFYKIKWASSTLYLQPCPLDISQLYFQLFHPTHILIHPQLPSFNSMDKSRRQPVTHTYGYGYRIQNITGSTVQTLQQSD